MKTTLLQHHWLSLFNTKSIEIFHDLSMIKIKTQGTISVYPN